MTTIGSCTSRQGRQQTRFLLIASVPPCSSIDPRRSYMDSDALPLANLDHLFLLPPVPLAAPWQYTGKRAAIRSTLMVVTPSEHTFERFVPLFRDGS